MRANDMFWFIENHLERIGKDERKKIVELIQGIDETPKLKKMSKDQEQRAEIRKRLERLF